jgi:hypothetical protein
MLAFEERPSRKELTVPMAVCAFVLAITGAQQSFAQAIGQATEQERVACRQDVKRFCQAQLQMNPDDMLSITGCLQDNRTRISRTCRNALESHGQ